MNKKWVKLLTGTILAAFLLTGCADDQDPAPPVTEDEDLMTEEPVDEMTPTPDDEVSPGETEEGEGTPGEEQEGTMENPEENMDQGMNGEDTDMNQDDENK